MRRVVTVLVVLALSTLFASAREVSNLIPDNPVLHRPAVELGRQQVSIEAKFVSISQTDADEIMFEAMAMASLNPTFETFSIDGAGAMTFTGSVIHQGAPVGGWGDMFWCGTYLWGSWDLNIHAYNTDGSDAGTWFVGPLNPTVALAYSGSWWYASSPGNYLWRGLWDWTPGGTPAWENITYDTIPDVSGIAYDSTIEKLWVVMTSNYVRQYGLDDGPMLAEVPLIDTLGNARACCMSNTTAYGPALLVLHSNQRSGDWVVFYDLSDTPVETTSWGAVKAMFR